MQELDDIEIPVEQKEAFPVSEGPLLIVPVKIVKMVSRKLAICTSTAFFEDPRPYCKPSSSEIRENLAVIEPVNPSLRWSTPPLVYERKLYKTRLDAEKYLLQVMIARLGVENQKSKLKIIEAIHHQRLDQFQELPAYVESPEGRAEDEQVIRFLQTMEVRESSCDGLRGGKIGK